MSNSENRFGTAAHAAASDAQKLDAGSSAERSTVIVVLSPTVSGNQLFRAESNGNVVQTVLQGKALNRIVDLLGMAGQSEPAYEILGPNGGAASSIDERIKLKDSAANILRYTVNGNVAKIKSAVSASLFKVAEKAANDNTTLATIAARFGVHAVAVVNEDQSYAVVENIRDQFTAYESSETSFVVAAKATQEQIHAPLIDWNIEGVLDLAVLLEGTAESFVVRSELHRVNFLINPNKGSNVSTEQKSLEVFKRADQSSVTTEEKANALIALGYSLDAMPDEEIAESYIEERKTFLHEVGAAISPEEEEEEESDEEEANASEVVAGILLEANLDREQLKALVYLLEMKVMKSDTVETLTVKILEAVESFDYDQVWAFAMEANTKLGGVAGFGDWINAQAEEEETEEEETEEESEESEEESEEETEEEEEESDDEESEEESEFSAEEQLADLLGEHMADRLIVRAIARSSTLQIKIFKSDDADSIFAKIAEQIGAFDEDQFVALIHSLADDETIAATFDDWADFEFDNTDYEALLAESDGSQLSHAERVAALEFVGIDTDGLNMVQVLKTFAEYHASVVEDDEDGEGEQEDGEEEEIDDKAGYEEDSEEESDDEESEDDSEEEEEENAEDENYALSAESVADQNQKFLSGSTDSDVVGSLLTVSQNQTLVINFCLTDRNTFEDIAEELENIEGVDYRVPFNMTEDREGSMYLPTTVILDALNGAASAPFHASSQDFNVEKFAAQLHNTLRSQIDSLIYEGRLPAGQDATTTGLVLGDFADENEEDLDDELDPDYLNELAGDHIPMASLYNAHLSVRPISADDDHTVVTGVVLNIAVPCIWGLDLKKIKPFVTSAYNRVLAHFGESDATIYVGFTMNSSSLVNEENLNAVLTSVRDMASDEVEVSSYSLADVQRVNESEDLMEAAHAIGSNNLPLLLLGSGVADAAFANGGDLTLLLSPVIDMDEDDSEEDEDEE